MTSATKLLRAAPCVGIALLITSLAGAAFVGPHVCRAAGDDTGVALPDGCDVLYQRLAPDSKQLAFVGHYNPGVGDVQYGLFVVELKSGTVRRLLDRALKTAPAWSPDSSKLAIGNAAGYVNRYPLVIVDVQTGKVTETGVYGVGAAWSPDGRFVAFSTEIVRGGSWSRGIPIDGRIGVWDTEKKRLTRVTPPGFNIHDDRLGGWAVGGSLNPQWSPDSRWIAYHRSTHVRRGKERRDTDEIWIVNREGTELRKALDYRAEVAWSPDSRSLILVGTDPVERIELSELPVIPQDELPKPPADFTAQAERAAEARARAKGFDPAPIFRRNRPWQNPSLEHLQSVQFLHRMKPIRLDERFVWRRDGTSLLEVVHREDESAAKEIGRLWITTPEPAEYYFSPQARYPKRQARDGAFLAGYFRNHLMGTHATFAAIDWGRDPQSFAVGDVKTDSEGKSLTIHLSPQSTPQRRRYYLNAGAMFQTTSWAYVHHLRPSRTEITVDSGDHRILREVDYGRDGEKLCEIEFLDWQDVGDEQSVPQRIHLRFPGNDFDVDYRFEWRPEGLWILKTGQSQFAQRDPQCQEIVDLKINEPTPRLDEKLTFLQQAKRQLEGGDRIEAQAGVIRARSFELGRKVRCAEGLRQGDAWGVEDVLFTLRTKGERFREMWSHPVLIAEIGLSSREWKSLLDDQLLIVLYDAAGRPLSSFQAPLAAISAPGGSADDLLEKVTAHNALWLAPDVTRLPEVSYAFRLGADGKVEQCRLQDSENPHCTRGVTLTLGLDAFVKSPSRYKAPVLFESMLDGREVVVAVITGPQFGLVWGNGISHSWHGYRVSVSFHGLLIVEKATGRPLVSRYGDAEVHFLDYVEVEPGKHAPLRIAMFGDRGEYDFRFQIVDGKVWLFDRSFNVEGQLKARTEEVAIDGAAPAGVKRGGEVKPLADLEPLDWSRLTDRRNLLDSQNPLAREIMETTRPFEHPRFDALAKVEDVSEPEGTTRRIAMDLGRSRVLKEAKSWTISRLTPAEPHARGDAEAVDRPAAAGGTKKIEVATYPVRWDEALVVKVPAGEAGKTEIRSAKLRKSDDGELMAELEIVSQDHMNEFQAVASAALLSDDNTVIAAATGDLVFRVKSEVYSSSDFVLNFGKPVGEQTPKHLLLGLRTIYIGGPMGSLWGRVIDQSPLFPFAQLLEGEDPRVWKVGLGALNDHLRREVMRREVFEIHVGDTGSSTRATTLKPYLGRFESLFGEAKDPEGLALLCRLAGHSGDKRFIEPMAGLIEHSDPAVQDGAAIGLGLLASAGGMERLTAILKRPVPEDSSARWALEELQIDAALALAAIGTDQAVHLLGETLVGAVPEGSGKSSQFAERLVCVVGRTTSPLILDYIAQILRSGDQYARVSRELFEVLGQFKDEEATMQIYLDGIRRGDGIVARYAPVLPALIPEVGKMILREDLDPWAFYRGVRYLKTAGNPKALDWLRQAHEQNLHADFNQGRLTLASALAALDDYRGLSDAFTILSELVNAGPLPEDPQERRKEERRRERELEDVLDDVLLESFPTAELAKFVAPRLESSDKPTLLASLTLAESLSRIPDDLKPPLATLAKHDDEGIAKRAALLVEKSQDK